MSHYEEHKKEYKENMQKWRLNHPDETLENRRKAKEYDAKYRQDHVLEIHKQAKARNDSTLANATKAGNAWTEEEITKLRKLLEDGKSFVEIAEILHRSYKSICNAKAKYAHDIKAEHSIAYYRGETR